MFDLKIKEGLEIEKQEAIEYLNKLQKGMFCTVNIPLYSNEKMPITVMYMGKDEQGRYNFIDTGRFIMSKEFIEQKSISIDKSFDEDKASEIYESVKRNTIKRSIKSKGKER